MMKDGSYLDIKGLEDRWFVGIWTSGYCGVEVG